MSERCKPLHIPEKFSTIDELSSFLRDWNISVKDWGKGAAKTVEHLWKEIEEGDSRLVVENGELIRVLNSAIIFVYYFDKSTGKFLYLKEIEQEFKKDHRFRRRGFIWSNSEKLKVDENPLDGATTCLHDELGILAEARQFNFIGRGVNKTNSQSFPKLESHYTNNKYFIVLTPDQYRPGGYIEEQEDKTTFWGWEEA